MKRREFLKGTLTAVAISVVPIPLHVFTGSKWSELVYSYLSISLLQKNGEEVTYDGYQRQTLPRTSEAWLIEELTVTNRIEIAFPMYGFNTENIEIAGVGIHDQNGECLVKTLLTASLFIFPGLIPSFMPGNLKITLENSDDVKRT